MSDEKKDVNSQQENVGKKGINKKLIIAFAGMGAVIVGLVIALILVATSGKKDVDSSASKAESGSAVASETDDTSEEDSVADESEDELMLMRRKALRKARTIKGKGLYHLLFRGQQLAGRRQGYDGHGDRY